jgi:hypothetical protein
MPVSRIAARMLFITAMVLGLGLGTARAAQTTQKTSTAFIYALSQDCETLPTGYACTDTGLGATVISDNQVQVCVYVGSYRYEDYIYSYTMPERGCVLRDASAIAVDKTFDSATIYPQEVQLSIDCSDGGVPCQGPNTRIVTMGATLTGVGEIEYHKDNDKSTVNGCTVQFHSKGARRQAVSTIVMDGLALEGQGVMYRSDDAMTIRCK